MTAPGNGIITLVLTMSILVSSAYAIGRIHQWYLHGADRDEAYRKGYDKASCALMDMMAADRESPPDGTRHGGTPATVTSIAGRTRTRHPHSPGSPSGRRRPYTT